jgi:hypothetical protein
MCCTLNSVVYWRFRLGLGDQTNYPLKKISRKIESFVILAFVLINTISSTSK